MIQSRLFLLLVFGCAIVTTSGCASLWPDDSSTKRGASSSLVDFLYPDGSPPPERTAKARLELPLRVGVGFVPGSSYSSALTESDRNALLQNIKQQFSELEYVQDIVVIPQTYLSGQDGLLAVEQVGRLYQLDVVGLVSYDQTLISEARKSSLLYWTILGAYVVKGNRNDVSTFVDLAVLDARSKKLLLRAGGVHHEQKNSTLVERSTVGRMSQLNGFKEAGVNLAQNFSVELEKFEESIKHSEDIEVVRRASGTGGAGALVLELGVLLSLFGGRRLLCSRTRSWQSYAKSRVLTNG